MFQLVDEGPEVLIQDGNLAFHGTTLEAALNIANGFPAQPIADQAEAFFATFGLSVRDYERDEISSSMHNFAFERNRDSELYVTDTFEKARSYSDRAPEWMHYAFEFIHRMQPDSGFQSWTEMAADFMAQHVRRAVVVIRCNWVTISKSAMDLGPLYTGGALQPPLANPMGDDCRVVQVVRLTQVE